jgi:glucan-binding YG repeat protein
VATAVLSITNKQKKKEQEKKRKDEDKMEVDEKKEEEKKEEEEKEKKEVVVVEEKKEEPVFELLSNPARVVKAQLRVINMEDGQFNILSHKWHYVTGSEFGLFLVLRNINYLLRFRFWF